MTAYYNEIDPYAAQWLRNLISSGHLPAGDVDERSIARVHPDDVRGYAQCHWFAGIGGWPLALRLAGMDDEFPIWTGSCPCQPFSIAGRQRAFTDDRHLWPSWFELIRECKPANVFGEQVASADGVRWAERVAQDLENENYAFGTAILPASSVGAPHQRDRFYFTAYALGADAGGRAQDRWRLQIQSKTARTQSYADWNGGRDSYDGLADGIPTSVAKRCANGFGNAIVPALAAEFILSTLVISGAAEFSERPETGKTFPETGKEIPKPTTEDARSGNASCPSSGVSEDAVKP